MEFLSVVTWGPRSNGRILGGFGVRLWSLLYKIAG